MGRFDIFTTQVDIEHNGKEHTYTLRPVTGKDIKRFYNATKGLQSLEEGDIKNLDSSSMEDLHYVAKKSLEDDDSEASDDKLDLFVSQHLLQLVEPLIKLHMDVDEEQLQIE